MGRPGSGHCVACVRETRDRRPRSVLPGPADMTRLLITGATGFLGVPCVRAAREHFEVHAVARDRDPHAEREVYNFHSCDLLNVAETIRLVEDIRPTHLLHLAWIVTPGVYWTSPENHCWVDASKRLLLAFARCGGQRAVITGTCAEYDWSVASRCHEFNTPTRPHTTYGRCKLELSKWAAQFSREREVRLAWARLFWMYGPREHPARLVPSVARSLLAGLPAACSTGTSQRDFLHGDDVADGLITLTKSELTGSVNIGSGEPVTVRSVIEHVANACGRPDLVRLGEREILATEPPLLVADVSRLRDELNWKPRLDLARGLREGVEWWRMRRAA